MDEIALERVHLVGIGGAGMSGLARILLARGCQVSGSDAKESRVIAALVALGARVSIGHDAANVRDAQVVVTSTAIRPDNVEVVAARESGVLVVPRAAMLAVLMADSQGIAIAGTHGKTTTTSMVTVALQHCGLDPSFAIGGDLNDAGSNAHHGTGTYFVAEADESDGSFLLLRPLIAVVTNVEADHLDHHGTPEAVYQAFDDFVSHIDPAGFLVTCADDPRSMQLATRARAEGRLVVTYGTDPAADLVIADLELTADGAAFAPIHRGRRLERLQLKVRGIHNARNAAAALLVGLDLGLPFAELATGLSQFTGARRRFEIKGEAGGVTVVDDYAHHPTEISATLAAARQVARDGRVIAVFQPHLYSRTKFFATELGEALGLADAVVVMDVYGAREEPVPGVNGALVATAVPLAADAVKYEPSWSSVAAAVASMAEPGDLVLTMGAGDVTQIGPEILRELGLG